MCDSAIVGKEALPVCRRPILMPPAVTQQTPPYLRLHVEEPAAAAEIPCVSYDALDRLCQSFRSATGWSLRQGKGSAPLQSPDVLWARTLSPDVEEPTHLAIRRSPGKSTDDIQNELLPLCDLVDSIADLVGEYHRTKEALIEREAELATGIPLIATPDDPAHLAQRLQAVLRGGAEAIGTQAAALYLLDDATNELKLRSAWGLPADRLLAEARPLRGAVADLEALTGHAVAIEDAALLPHWNVPEDFAAALCVPVASSTTPLGTLWFFSSAARDFTESQTGIAEIIAGRIVAELEREVLLASAAGQSGDRDGAALRQHQETQLPAGPIATDQWEVAAALKTSPSGGADFYDWTMREDGGLTVALGSFAGAGADAAMTSELVRGAAKSMLLAEVSVQQCVERVAEVAWTSTTGACQGSLAVVNLPAGEDEMAFCSAGPLGALIVRPTRPTAVSQGAPALASDPDARYSAARHAMAAGEAVVLVSDAVRKALNRQGEQLGEAVIADCVQQHLDAGAECIAEQVLELWREHVGSAHASATIVVAKRH